MVAAENHIDPPKKHRTNPHVQYTVCDSLMR